MDYLREGINLRAMGQRDPLAEWQREGYDMFEAMMATIEEDFVRYVTHLQVITEEAPRPMAANLRYSAPEDPVQGAEGLTAALAAPTPEPAEAAELGAHAGGPDLWEAPDRARGLLGELARAREDVTLVEGLERRLSDLETLHELGRQEGDDSVEPEIAAETQALAHELDRLELR